MLMRHKHHSCGDVMNTYQVDLVAHPIGAILGRVLLALLLIFVLGGCAEDSSDEDVGDIDFQLHEKVDSIKTKAQLIAAHQKDPRLFERRTIFGDTALRMLAQRGEPELVQAALDAGADISMTNRHGESALMAAVREVDRNKLEKYVRCIRILLQAGADPNEVTSWGTPTAWAHIRVINGLQDDVFRVLVEAGGDPDGIPDSAERIHLQVGANYVTAVSRLTKAGYEQRRPAPPYFNAANWTDLAPAPPGTGGCFVGSLYGGFVFIEPMPLRANADEPQLIGRLIVWHVFHRVEGDEYAPVYPESFDFFAETPDTRQDRLSDEFNVK